MSARKKPVKPLTVMASDKAEKLARRVPSDWSESKRNGYDWGLYDGFIAGYRAAQRRMRKP